MRPARFLLLAPILFSVIAGCGDAGDDASPTTSSSPAATTARRTSSPTPPPAPTQSPPPETPARTPHLGPPEEPLGFPFDPAVKLGLVAGEMGSRTVQWGEGPDGLSYTRDSQPSSDPGAANRSGWNCRVHVEFENIPAVDWYLPPGTPILATMDGTATLFAVTTSNGFDYWGVPREPYLGNPDRSRASVSPFPGPSGGLGVYVEIDNGRFLTTSAHLDLPSTASALPGDAFYAGYSAGSDFASLFTSIPASRAGTPIAQWQVRRGHVIGYSGDAGYSEAPHLHYTVQRGGSNALLCPTAEADFEDGGWLLK